MKAGLIIYVVGNDIENFTADVTLQGQIPAWAAWAAWAISLKS